MDKISITYENIQEYVDGVVGRIIDAQGDCTGLNLCIACPFFDECCKSIKDEARFLDKSTRLRKAEAYLFDKALELEIG